MSTVLRRVGVLGLVAAAVAWAGPARSQEPLPPPPDAAQARAADDGVSVQARGPVHEAYAQPLDQKPPPGPVVPKGPPDPITEIPPDQKPEGDNVQWIPGYWAWDDGRNDFLWVSGFWRVVPPGRKWVPGHWQQVEGGWQWIAGFWAPQSQGEVPYLPPPPASLDYGPTTPPPDDNSIWAPGCWVYRDNDYAWQAGTWLGAQPGYVWQPPHYCYTPAGYAYVSGYWDYALADRGLLCAPAYFSQPLWQTPGWCYRPSYCVDLAGLLSSLWVRPGWSHYYFGDYYGDRWRGRGFHPWLAWSARHYDPLFAYGRWHHRGDPGWYRGLRDEHLARLHGDLPRLPHTLAEQRALFRDRGFRGGAVPHVVTAVSQFRPAGFHLATVDRRQLLASRQAAEHFRAVGHERQAREQLGRPGGPRPGALSLGRVPTVAAGGRGLPVVAHNAYRPGPELRARPFAPGPGARAESAFRPGVGSRGAGPLGVGRPPADHAAFAAPHVGAARPPVFAAPHPGHAAPAGSPHPFAGRPPAPAFHSEGHPLPGNFHAGHVPSFAGHGGGHAPAGGGHAHGGGGHAHGGHH